jgi:UDP-2-acetamido-3-amino-2,3-dideoxy-glucuronate N-acetyltransferase
VFGLNPAVKSDPLTSRFMPANICVVGCGYWGKNLARNYSQLNALFGICESDEARLRDFAAQYPQAKAYSDLSQALADPEIQGVVLASPAEMHHRMALAALRARKHVFVEKPLALDWRDGMEMVAAAEANRRILMVGHLLRYHPAILKIQELLAAGTLGKIEYIYSNRLSMGKIRREENALWSFAPHDISVILKLTGEMPIQVSASGGAYLQPNIADVTVSHLLFDHGVRAHIFVSWLHPYKEQRLVVIGSKQMIVFEDSRADQKLMLFDKRIEMKNGALEAARPEGTPVPFVPEEPLRRECLHFLEAIERGAGPETPGEEGVAVLQVLQACQRSLQMNGQPVAVDYMGAQKVAVL